MNKNKISPFTQTPGIAGKALIKTHYSDEIIENFLSDDSYKYVYKIVGLRGSGKSVEYSMVMEYFRGQKNWLVYTLSSGGNPIATLISLLSREDFIDDKLRNISLGLSGGIGGNIAILSAKAHTNATHNITHNHNY